MLFRSNHTMSNLLLVSAADMVSQSVKLSMTSDASNPLQAYLMFLLRCNAFTKLMVSQNLLPRMVSQNLGLVLRQAFHNGLLLLVEQFQLKACSRTTSQTQ